MKDIARRLLKLAEALITAGASDFIVTAQGKTAEEAFHNAKRDAPGRDGYSGTIAEVSDFKMINVDAMNKWAIKLLQAEERQYTPDAQVEIKRELAKAESAKNKDWDKIDKLREQQVWVGRNDDLESATEKERQRIADRIQNLKGRSSRTRATIQAMFDFSHPDIQSKSTCGCIELKPGKYVFFGWARS